MRTPTSFIVTLLWRSGRSRTLAALACSTILLTGCGLFSPLQEDTAAQVQGSEFAAGTLRSPVYLDLNRNLILRVQQQLTDLGYHPGLLDGVYGPTTEGAVISYQRAKGLPSDGRITDVFLNYLDAEHLPTHKGAFQNAAGPSDPPAEVVSEDADSNPGTGLGPAPAYLPGSRYFFSDKSVHEVLAVKGQRVEWRNNRGEKFTSHRVFLVPPSSWTTRDEAGQRVFDRVPEDLWRALPGSDAAFVATSTRRRRAEPTASQEMKFTWRCRAGAKEKVTVPAGRFETWHLTCERLSETGAIDLIRTWNYAPRLRHFVKRRDLNPATGAEESVELLAITPQGRDWPPAAEAGLEKAVQHALENLPPGRSLDWTSSAVEPAVTLQVGRRVVSASNSDCRRFSQSWVIGATTWTFPSVACRGQTGDWIYPNLGDGSRVAQSQF